MHCAITSLGLETMNIGEPITGTDSLSRKISGSAIMYSLDLK
jgi:hypothetical protein